MSVKALKKKQSPTCYPRGINTSYDASKNITFQILNWEGIDEGLGMKYRHLVSATLKIFFKKI